MAVATKPKLAVVKKPTYLTFCDDVTQESVGPLLALITDAFNAEESPQLTLFITTHGGHLYSALGYYDRVQYLLRQQPGASITTVAQGFVMSSGLVMMQAATKRLSFPHTLFLSHEPSTTVTEDDAEGRIRSGGIAALKQSHEMAVKHVTGLLANCTGISASDWRNRMEEGDTYFTAEQAKKWGLIDELVA